MIYICCMEDKKRRASVKIEGSVLDAYHEKAKRLTKQKGRNITKHSLMCDALKKGI